MNDAHEAPGEPAAPVSPYYTPAEVAALFRRKPRTIRLWAKAGFLTRVKVCSATYYYRSEIDRLLAGDVPQ